MKIITELEHGLVQVYAYSLPIGAVLLHKGNFYEKVDEEHAKDVFGKEWVFEPHYGSLISKEQFNYIFSKFIICSFLHFLFKENQFEVNEMKYFVRKQKDEKMIQSFQIDINQRKEVLNSFDEELIKIIKSFQTDIEKAIEFHLKKFKKLS